MSETTAANPFSPRAVAFLVGAGVLLALAVLMLIGFGTDINRATGTGGAGAAPNDKTAPGFYGLQQLIAKTGPYPPGMATKSTDVLQPGLMILTPTIATDPDDIVKIVSRREAHAFHGAPSPESEDPDRAKPLGDLPTLIVLPKWAVMPVSFQPGRVQRIGMYDPRMLARLVPFVKAKMRITDRKPVVHPGTGLRPFLVPDMPQTVKSDAIDPLISAGPDGAVLGKFRGRNVYVLADPDLLDNYALRTKANARAALALLAAINPDDPAKVTFDLSLHYAAGDRNLLKLMFTPPFLAVTVALLVAGLLAGLATANRFGPPRREGRAVALGKAALIDNIAALTRLAGRSADGGARYAAATREWLARRLRLQRSLTGAALDTHLDKLAPPGAPTLETLTHRLEEARGEDELVRAARHLHDWRKDLIS